MPRRLPGLPSDEEAAGTAGHDGVNVAEAELEKQLESENEAWLREQWQEALRGLSLEDAGLLPGAGGSGDEEGEEGGLPRGLWDDGNADGQGPGIAATGWLTLDGPGAGLDLGALLNDIDDDPLALLAAAIEQDRPRCAGWGLAGQGMPGLQGFVRGPGCLLLPPGAGRVGAGFRGPAVLVPGRELDWRQRPRQHPRSHALPRCSVEESAEWRAAREALDEDDCGELVEIGRLGAGAPPPGGPPETDPTLELPGREPVGEEQSAVHENMEEGQGDGAGPSAAVPVSEPPAQAASRGDAPAAVLDAE